MDRVDSNVYRVNTIQHLLAVGANRRNRPPILGQGVAFSMHPMSCVS